MSGPVEKHENVAALALLDEDGDYIGHYLRRWPGKVTKNLAELTGINGNPSGEWKVEITSKFLKEPVTAIVNENWAPSTPVQFHLDPKDKNGKTAVTFFKKVRQVDSKPKDNELWQKGRWKDSDYK